MTREKKQLSVGKDYTEMVPMFRDLVLKSGVKKGDSLMWAGCPGTCYAMSTFFSYGLRDLGLNLYFALDADTSKVFRLELKDTGIVATKKEKLIKAKVLVLMSGLVRVPFENVLRLVREGLAEGGIIIGETVVPGLFEKNKWDQKIPFRYLFEFSIERPSSFEK